MTDQLLLPLFAVPIKVVLVVSANAHTSVAFA
jgi:hypothetical protein